jgi:hypothetical protein
LTCLLCLFQTGAEYANDVFDLGLKLLDLRDSKVWILRAAANAVKLVVYCSERGLGAAKGSVVPMPFSNSGANLEGFGPVGIVDVEFIWSDTNNWA